MKFNEQSNVKEFMRHLVSDLRTFNQDSLRIISIGEGKAVLNSYAKLVIGGSENIKRCGRNIERRSVPGIMT